MDIGTLDTNFITFLPWLIGLSTFLVLTWLLAGVLNKDLDPIQGVRIAGALAMFCLAYYVFASGNRTAALLVVPLIGLSVGAELLIRRARRSKEVRND